MSVKTVVILISMLTISLVGIMGGFAYIYKERPELLGLRKQVPPPIVIVTTASMVLDTNAIQVGVERREKERILSDIDSLGNVISTVRDSVSLLQARVDSLKNIEGLLKEDIEFERQRLAQLGDSVVREDLQTFAKIYNSTDPKVVAELLENIDTRDAATVLKLMKKKVAAQVMEEMSPEMVAIIMQNSTVTF